MKKKYTNLLTGFQERGLFVKIAKEELETIKKAHDLRAVIESYGVTLKKKGSNYVGLCPFHKEKTPSFTVNPKTNLYHCFGCNAGGDVIGFICKKDNISFREAVEKLSSQGQVARVKEKAKDVHPASGIVHPESSINRSYLLNRVVSFYHQSFCEDPRALDYLKSRGITDNNIFSDFTIGFSNGTLLNTIPNEGDIREALKDIGILNERGHEMFYGCAVFPIFDENKDCVGLYGRRIERQELSNSINSTNSINSPTHLYLPGPRRGVFNFQAAKRSKSIILTESIIDAVTLYNAGFKDVIPCYGVNGFTKDQIDLLTRSQVKEVYICFDKDDAGTEGAEKIAAQLKEKGIEPYIVKLPAIQNYRDKVDINTFFLLTAEASVVFERLLKESNHRASIRSDKIVKHEQKAYEKTDTGLVVQYNDRRYDVRGIMREGVKLKATIKAAQQKSGDKAPRFHLDTVDLYSNRSRLFFAKACAVLFTEKEEIITEDITRLIDLAESWTPSSKDGSSVQKMTKSEEDEALEFLKDVELFSRILVDFETVGITGEDANKLMGYLAATSRKLDEPLSILIQSRSAAGKSTLQDAVLSLVPAEDYIKYTRLTGQALFYKEEDSLVHKLLAIEEEHGARDASYSIRNIQSSKYLSIAATGKDPVTGKLRTEEYKVKGPVSLMITTTEVELDYETSNRFIILTVDESKEMTERILQKQRESETLEGLIKKAETEHVTTRHHNAQRLLRPLSVINPYASHLTFPAESLRARRDHKKYLGLIKAIAFLHQYQREIKTVSHNGSALQYIEVILDDIKKANILAAEILGRTLDELSPPSRLLLKMIREMVEAGCKQENVEPKTYCFTRKDIREWSRWSDFQIKCHIRQLEDLEYIYSVVGKKGKEYIYELLYPGGGEDGKPFLMGLTSVEQLKEKMQNNHGDTETRREAKGKDRKASQSEIRNLQSAIE
jgi:DNA primase